MWGALYQNRVTGSCVPGSRSIRPTPAAPKDMAGTRGVPLRLLAGGVILRLPQPQIHEQACVKRQRNMDAEKLRVTRDKLTRVFRYLEALNQHRNPAKRQIHEQPWSLRLRDLPEHTAIQRGAAKASAPKAKDGNGKTVEEAGTGYVLKVQRPRLSRA